MVTRSQFGGRWRYGKTRTSPFNFMPRQPISDSVYVGASEGPQSTAKDKDTNSPLLRFYVSTSGQKAFSSLGIIVRQVA